MRRSQQHWEGDPVRDMVSNAWRRYDWFLSDATSGQVLNLARAVPAFATGRSRMRAAPVMLKIDISPVCNLKCTYCVHARGDDFDDDVLRDQFFSSRQRMTVEQLGRIVDEVRGKTTAIALYYVGDPLVHPDLDEMCGIVRDARMRSHVSTNFSFVLDDDRLDALVRSGLTHLTVSIESLDQERYSRTRVGGRIDLVLDNLDRLLRIRAASGLRHPRVEVQFIHYQHNDDELEEVARWCEARGVDQLTVYWGNLHNYTDLAPERVRVDGPRARRALPRCAWPWFAMQILWEGSVIPCCYHRVSEQYRADGDARVVGNVFTDGVLGVWESLAYGDLRRIAADPVHGVPEARRDASFCHGCGQLFETTEPEQRKVADSNTWEAVYFRDDRGHVLRR
jgi:MoaA/NifB/PqqE/SkfB family radical SAM enzyme